MAMAGAQADQQRARRRAIEEDRIVIQELKQEWTVLSARLRGGKASACVVSTSCEQFFGADVLKRRRGAADL